MAGKVKSSTKVTKSKKVTGKTPTKNIVIAEENHVDITEAADTQANINDDSQDNVHDDPQNEVKSNIEVDSQDDIQVDAENNIEDDSPDDVKDEATEQETPEKVMTGGVTMPKPQQMVTCEVCNNELNAYTWTSTERATFKRTGMCPTCYQNHIKARNERIAANKARNKATRQAVLERRKNNPSAASLVRQMLETATFDDEQLKQVMDFNLTRAKTKIAYPLLKEITSEQDWETETYFSGVSRYQKKPLAINDKMLYMTNNIYVKNVPLVKQFLIDIGSLQDVAE